MLSGRQFTFIEQSKFHSRSPTLLRSVIINQCSTLRRKTHAVGENPNGACSAEAASMQPHLTMPARARLSGFLCCRLSSCLWQEAWLIVVPFASALRFVVRPCTVSRCKQRRPAGNIRPCRDSDREAVLAIINAAALAYRAGKPSRPPKRRRNPQSASH